MKIKVSDATPLQLDWLVATALGRGPKHNMESHGRTWHGWWLAAPGYDYEPMPNYSAAWAQGGPIIERERFEFRQARTGMLASYQGGETWFGPTHLIAAMRCYVASKLGDTIDIPEELK